MYHEFPQQQWPGLSNAQIYRALRFFMCNVHAQNNYARESIIVNDVITFVISIMRSHFTFAIIIVARCTA